MVFKLVVLGVAAVMLYVLFVFATFVLASYGEHRLAVQYRQDSQAQARVFQLQREVRLYQEKMQRSVCRDGKAYVLRRRGNLTYYDPVTWNGQVTGCR